MCLFFSREGYESKIEDNEPANIQCLNCLGLVSVETLRKVNWNKYIKKGTLVFRSKVSNKKPNESVVTAIVTESMITMDSEVSDTVHV